ncbi:MAG: alpha/beta fold hydrolase [Bacteroidetes bacterium]|nr:alpha/beta fold hydrolase [Bacteroidota bacterium]
MNRKNSILAISVWIFSLLIVSDSYACTNLIVTRGAGKDGSVMITYSADSHTRYGAIAFYPAADHQPGSMCDVYHYESGKFLGQIPEVPHTYTVIQFMNEHQVAIGETTFGGLDSLQSQPGAILDYGSLMRIGLQRAKTARELIQVMTALADQYGYASSGESFAVSDKSEAWILEMIGRGRYGKGTVWVARLIPDGYVSGHANQARITTFPFQSVNQWDDPEQTVFHSPDVIRFARDHGFYRGSDEAFSFSDVYNPVDFGGARYCDARVWSFFRKIDKEVRENKLYTAYAQGKLMRHEQLADGSSNPNGFVSNRLPLWVKADTVVTLEMVMDAMRDHYEDTPMDMRFDLGAGPYQSPYRWRPMEFEVDGVKYLNERAVATQQTGYTFVAQSRSWLPDPIGGIFWFGVDDADGCVFAPMYCGIHEIPESYAVGNGSMIAWSETSAFWTFSQVNNWAYSRYNVIHPEIEKYQQELESTIFSEIRENDKKAIAMYREDPATAKDFLTDYSVQTGNQLVKQWKAFYHYLFMKYIDGNVKQTEGHQLLENGFGRGVPKRPSQPGYGSDWERKMVEGTGDRLRVGFPVPKPFENSRFVTVDSVRLHYHTWGELAGSRGKVLFIHGFAGNTFCWRNNIDTLVKAGYYVVAVDLSSFGYSDRRIGINHSQSNRARILWNLLDVIDRGDKRKWNLVGHSMGGGIAEAMALTRLDRTQSLLIVDGMVFSKNKDWNGAFITLVRNEKISQTLADILEKNLITEKTVRRMLKNLYVKKPDATAVIGYLQPLLIEGTAASALTIWSNSREIRRFDADVLEPIPVMAIWGEKDTWIRLSSAKLILNNMPIDKLIVIPKAKHSPMETHSEVFNGYMMDFFKSSETQ